MFYTDYDQETMPFIIEGQHTTVLGVGEVTGRIAIAHTPVDILRDPRFEQEGTIPVLLDEFTVTDEHNGCFDQVNNLLRAGLWAGFVTFGSSEMIVSRRRTNQDPSHFMITLRALAEGGGFIAVIEQDDRTDFSPAILRSETSALNGVNAALRAESSTKALIEMSV